MLSALCAGGLRAVVALQAWDVSPSHREPGLDAEYYLAWAADIARGDVLGRAGTVHGEPFLLNPLYAYVLSPMAAVFGAAPAPVVAFQVLLAAGTAALAAEAARRFSGTLAAWVAGLAVAFSAALTHLDGYVSVSGLAAFLVAGACLAAAPREREERPRDAALAGLWLGLSALARPVALFAVPFFAWRFARGPRRAAMAAAVVVPFALLSCVTLARNVAVSGEFVVWTAANGQNAYIGNNPVARERRAMFIDEIRFAPRDMHVDAKYRVAAALGREPTRSEISSWYMSRALDEWIEHPGASAGWTLQKLRWFLTPEEPASSADYDADLAGVPALRLAFVPTWLIASLALAAIVVATRRRELLLGPGSLVAAHVVACTLSFPLSHYRSPAIPAMAVLAGAAVAAAVASWRTPGRRAALAALVAASLAALVGRVPPQPAYRADQYLLNAAAACLNQRNWAGAARNAREAMRLVPGSVNAQAVLMDAALFGGNPRDARPYAEALEARMPWDPLYAVQRARIELADGQRDIAFRKMDDIVARYPWSAELVMRRAELHADGGDLDGAARDARAAMARGVAPPAWLVERLGLR